MAGFISDDLRATKFHGHWFYMRVRSMATPIRMINSPINPKIVFLNKQSWISSRCFNISFQTTNIKNTMFFFYLTCLRSIHLSISSVSSSCSISCGMDCQLFLNFFDGLPGGRFHDSFPTSILRDSLSPDILFTWLYHSLVLCLPSLIMSCMRHCSLRSTFPTRSLLDLPAIILNTLISSSCLTSLFKQRTLKTSCSSF